MADCKLPTYSPDDLERAVIQSYNHTAGLIQSGQLLIILPFLRVDWRGKSLKPTEINQVVQPLSVSKEESQFFILMMKST